VKQPVLARRAANLSTAIPPAHVPSELGEDVIPFDSGFAFPQVLPDLTRHALDALTTHRDESLQYAATHGQRQLRSWIAQYMNADGCVVSPDDVLIVNGAKNGLDLICRLLLDEGDAIVVTAPMYFTAVPIFRSFGVEFIEVTQDEAGLRIDELRAALEERERAGRPPPKFIYNVTDFHNPAGLTLSLERRQALVEIATRMGIYLVEDNPYRRVRFEGESLPTLKALDREGLVFHVGTFSKLIAPGLRLGWIAARRELIARLIQLKADGGANPLMQRIVHAFCSSAEFEAHVRKVQDTYREHRDRMIAAVQRELPGATLNIPHGGYYLWVSLPELMDSQLLAREAEHSGVHVIAGPRFFAGSSTSAASSRAFAKHHLRLSYSYATVDQIDAGIQRLGRLYRAQLAA
jgi:2-aminoadipate transaminase